jgi:hypothetical protein
MSGAACLDGVCRGFGLGLLIASAFSTFFWWWAVGAALFGVALIVAALALATSRD